MLIYLSRQLAKGLVYECKPVTIYDPLLPLAPTFIFLNSRGKSPTFDRSLQPQTDTAMIQGSVG